MRSPLIFLTCAAGLAAARAPSAAAADSPPAEKIPIAIDTDIGSDVDDAFALALALASPELDLQAVTTCGEDAETRAWMVCRLLTAVGRRDVPVAWGRDPQPKEANEARWCDGEKRPKPRPGGASPPGRGFL